MGRFLHVFQGGINRAQAYPLVYRVLLSPCVTYWWWLVSTLNAATPFPFSLGVVGLNPKRARMRLELTTVLGMLLAMCALEFSPSPARSKIQFIPIKNRIFCVSYFISRGTYLKTFRLVWLCAHLIWNFIRSTFSFPFSFP